MRRIAVGIMCGFTLLTCSSGMACGSGSSTSKATTTLPPPAVTTTTVPGPTIEVRPASGPVGTMFQLLGTRFQSAEKVTFDITFPDAKIFKGQVAHPATADGTVSATFRVTPGNPLGVYQVKAAGDKGTQAGGQFEVTAAGATTTTVTGHPATTVTGRTTTTVKR
jgi:hypothetical protein